MYFWSATNSCLSCSICDAHTHTWYNWLADKIAARSPRSPQSEKNHDERKELKTQRKTRRVKKKKRWNSTNCPLARTTHILESCTLDSDVTRSSEFLCAYTITRTHTQAFRFSSSLFSNGSIHLYNSLAAYNEIRRERRNVLPAQNVVSIFFCIKTVASASQCVVCVCARAVSVSIHYY